MSEVLTAQIENILLDVGVVYLDYGLAGERVLAPTRGGGSFVVEQEVRIIERDGALGKEKGLRRVTKEDATLTVNIMDMSMANLKMALAGSTLASTTVTSTLTGSIADTEYFTNITWIGTDLEGKSKIITLSNPLADNGLNLKFTDKDEAVVEIAFSGHRDPTDDTVALYTIEEAETAATDLSDLTISAGTLEPTFAASTYAYGVAEANEATNVTVTPTGASADWIKVNGTVVASGAASGAIALDVGYNLITIRVHEDEKTDIEYKIHATRADS